MEVGVAAALVVDRQGASFWRAVLQLAKVNLGATQFNVNLGGSVLALLQLTLNTQSNALHLAANSSKNPKIIEALLAAGANIDARNYLGETALIMAVNGNSETKMTTQLIKSGADVNACDYQGHSVLDYARAAKRTYVINLLKEHGAN